MDSLVHAFDVDVDVGIVEDGITTLPDDVEKGPHAPLMRAD